ncbi:hypothetical protein Bca52824_009200 [Brassica carinata]|uniref:RRM domain-containing protein n=1 Tax=Brassica carinata TaxID=52824 RepID=A0A8X8B9Z5_BRACI|nr:hypothetical protein Bca52824_009200 [Brassica carinata]
MEHIVLLVEDLDTNNKSESDIKDILRNHFSVCGNVYKIYIPKNDTGGCLSFAFVFLIQNISKLEQMENLLEINGHEIKLSDYTFQARFKDIKAKMEAEGIHLVILLIYIIPNPLTLVIILIIQ